MKSLYHISKEALDLAEMLEVGELTPELEQRLTINQNELQEKAINYGYVIKDADGNITAIDNEIERLNALKKSEERKRNILKERISSAMQFYGIEKVETSTLKLSFRRSESVEIVSVEQLPDDYMIKKVTVSPDKSKIKEDIKKGKEVPGAVINENLNLQIK
jgi:hypothetical protein